MRGVVNESKQETSTYRNLKHELVLILHGSYECYQLHQHWFFKYGNHQTTCSMIT